MRQISCPHAEDDSSHTAASKGWVFTYVENISNATMISIATWNTKFLWGMTPALDVLNLEFNEALGYDKDLSLNFNGTVFETVDLVYVC